MSLWLRRTWIKLTADRRRLAVLAGTLTLGLLLWARLIIVNNIPRTAVATPSAESGQPKAENGHPSAGSGQPKSEIRPPKAQSRPPQIAALTNTDPSDPFVISPQYFPRSTQSTSLTHEPDKSGIDPAEDVEQAAARRTAQLQAMLAPMRLDASLGEQFAVIAGKSYRRGDVIKGPWNEDAVFVLIEVRQRSAILECEGRRFELKMPSPGRE